MERGGSPYRAMLLSDVILGKTIKLKNDSPGLTEVRTKDAAAAREAYELGARYFCRPRLGTIR